MSYQRFFRALSTMILYKGYPRAGEKANFDPSFYVLPEFTNPTNPAARNKKSASLTPAPLRLYSKVENSHYS